MNKTGVIIIGGGLAGLTAAIHLAKQNVPVTLFEKEVYPHHKVCGEYVSNEIVPYLNSLDIYLENAVPIDTMQLTTLSGKSLETKLPLGGLGISRYAFDNLLYEKAVELNVVFVFEAVNRVVFSNERFEVTTANHKVYAPFAIGCYGKRSVLDKKLNREFIGEKSEWLGVKAHYTYDNFPDHLVALHNFRGGYGGLSKTETGVVNFCYLTNYESFKQEKGIESFNDNVVAQNPYLSDFLKNATPIFDKPLTIAQISFHQKPPVEDHMLMCGDSAGLIHPLCGNGMAMAIHSAKIASELIVKHRKFPKLNRSVLEKTYAEQWQNNFGSRLRAGRKLQSVLLNDNLTRMGLRIVTKSPTLLRNIIKRTHGKPITC
ncbi:NAD(P)/FAD-dependent oxidoreductase [Costertonia aggregata]|uniref:NAD(P)/FAD-dependent oxidoreductase n=1 Tax=Costertonia aggregata TaxID=343403 RepID=A0A7H9AU31_9FLAO|nr:NAD(P)/FAD-dependent oxidoreductase [Costertonia aggregata]QLG46959.1 NAD(P)/FAD-dependent oxidoreductase [Costertonia aggregata]